MKLMKRFTAVLLCAGLLASCTAPTPPASQPESPAQSESERFAAYTRETFIREVTSDGVTLHYGLADPSVYGITEEQKLSLGLGNYTLEYIEEYEQQVHADLEALAGFDREQLTDSQKMTYDILKSELDLELTSEGMGLYASYNNSRDGILTSLPGILADYRIESEKDVKAYLTLLADLPRCYKDALAFEQKRAAAGMFMPEIALDEVVKVSEAFLEKPEESVMLTSFEERLNALEGLDAAAKQDYIDQNSKLWLETIVPAGQALLDGLKALRPQCREPLGLAHAGAKGKDYYKYIVLASTGFDGTMEELIELLDEKIIDALRAVMIVQGSSSGISEQAYAYYDDPIELGTPQEMLEKLKELAKTDYPPLGDVEYQIKYVPSALEDSTAPAYYLRPPIDQPARNLIYINNKNQKDALPQELFNILSHEGYPGHLYQTNYFIQQNTDPLRSQLYFKGYTEGWADYADERGLNWLGMDDRAVRMLRNMQRYDVLLTARLDIGVNYEGWDRDELKEYMSQFGLQDDELVDAILLSVIDDPANALPYIVGHLEFDKMRLDAMKAIGDSFDLQAFHKVVLDCGPAPFAIVRAEVDEYVASVTGAATSGDASASSGGSSAAENNAASSSASSSKAAA